MTSLCFNATLAQIGHSKFAANCGVRFLGDSVLKEPQLNIPCADDYYYDGDVDERYALGIYLGKDIDFAEQRYYTFDALSMLQDFSLVGAKAFRYYVFGAFRYLQSVNSRGESDVYACLPEVFERKIAENPDAFISIAKYLINFCDWAVLNYEKFDLEGYEDIYGDVKSGYLNLKELATKLDRGQI